MREYWFKRHNSIPFSSWQTFHLNGCCLKTGSLYMFEYNEFFMAVNKQLANYLGAQWTLQARFLTTATLVKQKLMNTYYKWHSHFLALILSLLIHRHNRHVLVLALLTTKARSTKDATSSDDSPKTESTPSIAQPDENSLLLLSTYPCTRVSVHAPAQGQPYRNLLQIKIFSTNVGQHFQK